MREPYLTKINNVSIFANVDHNYRTTKGGKKILIGKPSYSLDLTLEIDEIPELQTRSYVMVDKVTFMYSKNGEAFILRNACIRQHGSIQFNAKHKIEVLFLGNPCVGEGSY